MSNKTLLRKRFPLILFLVTIPLLILLFPFFVKNEGFQEATRYTNPFYGFAKNRESARRSSCQNNLKQIAMAMRQYAIDHHDKFPPSIVGGVTATGWDSQNYSGPEPWKIGVKQSLRFYQGKPVGWADGIFPYLRSDSLYMCPSETTGNLNRSNAGYTDYWLNGNLASVPQKLVVLPIQTLLIGDGNDGSDNSNATYSKTSFGSWLDDQSSPMYRHLGGANYLFVDGHIKWLKPQDVKNFGGRSDPFALK